MAQITVGVPVYNGDALLDECLESLAKQTFTDFEVLIFDNASTDRTGEIAQSWATRDSRFRYVRQPFNKGATQNFLDVLEAATSPYFLWRAYDDLSDPNSFEVAMKIFASRPQTDLAVTAVRQVKANGKQRELLVSEINNGLEPLRLWTALMHSAASWFYGVWRREVLKSTFATIWSHYPYGWGSDHLTLFPLLIENRIAGSNEAFFIQRMPGKPEGADNANKRPPSADMLRQRREYREACDAIVAEMDIDTVRRIALQSIMPFYISKRVYSLSRIAQSALAEKLAR